MTVQWIGGHSSPRKAFGRLRENVSIHALSDGTWSLSDGIMELLRVVGPSDLVIATWTASAADIKRGEVLLRSKKIRSMKMLVDSSFASRQPRYCAAARKAYGDDAIRIWNCHAKFVILTGGKFDVLYLSSANFNRNRRIENHTVIGGGELPGHYFSMVLDLFEMQAPGEGYGTDKAKTRRHSERIYRKRARERR